MIESFTPQIDWSLTINSSFPYLKLTDSPGGLECDGNTCSSGLSIRGNHMRSLSLLCAAAGFAVLSAAPAAAEVKIYPYKGDNYCPAGLQPVQIDGVICCGTPNQSVSYSHVKSVPATKRHKHKHVKRYSHSHVKRHTHTKTSMHSH